MEMVRWLISNRIVQVAWGLGLIAVLLSWIFGGKSADHASADADSNAKVEQVAKAEVKSEPVVEVKQEVETTNTQVQAAVATGAAATVAVAAATTDVVAETAEEATAVTEEVASESTEAVTEAVEVSTETVEAVATEEVVETTEAEATESSEVAVAETSEVVAESESEATSISGELSEKSSDDLLTMAREAYWNNGLDEAAEIYTALIEREPDAFEHKGELGNVFWRQGYPKKAAELYAEIAEPMIKAGNGERVSNMVGFIGLFFPEKAANIRTLLDQ